MSIVRAPRPESGFYALDRQIAEDKSLSWAARGLLIYLLVKPDHWQVSIANLKRQTADARITTGRDGLYALIGELEAAGYITRDQSRDEAGKLGKLRYLVRERPLTDQPLPDKPYTAGTTQDKTKKEGKTEKNLLVANATQTADEIKNLYNRICQEMRSCKRIGMDRLARIKVLCKTTLPTMDHWEAYFEACSEIDSFNGRLPPRPPYDKPFRASMDFLLRESTITGVLERE